MIHAATEPVDIAASPERVREAVLDFGNIPKWHTAHFKYIEVPSGKAGRDLVEGDKLKIALTLGMTFSPVILNKENSPAKFKWRGSLPGIFTGDHVFEFLPSDKIPGGTKFVQYEDFTGLLSFTMSPEKKSGVQNMDGFIAFNNDLKRKVESEK